MYDLAHARHRLEMRVKGWALGTQRPSSSFRRAARSLVHVPVEHAPRRIEEDGRTVVARPVVGLFPLARVAVLAGGCSQLTLSTAGAMAPARVMILCFPGFDACPRVVVVWVSVGIVVSPARSPSLGRFLLW
jgi:hypothetical protein